MLLITNCIVREFLLGKQESVELDAHFSKNNDWDFIISGVHVPATIKQANRDMSPATVTETNTHFFFLSRKFFKVLSVSIFYIVLMPPRLF